VPFVDIKGPLKKLEKPKPKEGFEKIIVIEALED
jgi:hypothetical protein